MTIVLKVRYLIQFYENHGDDLVPAGEPIVLNKGDVGYIKANRIHDANYVEQCKLVYVHDKAFGFIDESSH